MKNQRDANKYRHKPTEQVDQFFYLGGVITADCKSERNCNRFDK